MRYLAALCYALAIAAHTGDLVNTLVLGGLVLVGTVATFFALEAIIRGAVGPTMLQRDEAAWRSYQATVLERIKTNGGQNG